MIDQARALYRSMNTYDIAQLLHVPEAQVYRAVFGTRAALLQRNVGANGSVPFHFKEPSQ